MPKQVNKRMKKCRDIKRELRSLIFEQEGYSGEPLMSKYHLDPVYENEPIMEATQSNQSREIEEQSCRTFAPSLSNCNSHCVTSPFSNAIRNCLQL